MSGKICRGQQSNISGKVFEEQQSSMPLVRQGVWRTTLQYVRHGELIHQARWVENNSSVCQARCMVYGEQQFNMLGARCVENNSSVCQAKKGVCSLVCQATHVENRQSGTSDKVCGENHSVCQAKGV